MNALGIVNLGTFSTIGTTSWLTPNSALAPASPPSLP